MAGPASLSQEGTWGMHLKETSLLVVQMKHPSSLSLLEPAWKHSPHSDLTTFGAGRFFSLPAPKVVRGSGGTKGPCPRDPSSSSALHSGQEACRTLTFPPGALERTGSDLRVRLGGTSLACHGSPGCPLVAALGLLLLT